MSNLNPSFSLDLEILEKEIQAKEQERRETAYSDLSGQIAGTKSARNNFRSNQSSNFQQTSYDPDFDTLDEPVWDTIKRDLMLISSKFSKVLRPSSKGQNIIKDWDLWGPLFICVALSLLLQSSSSMKGPQFTQVFSLAFFGSFIVTLNIKLLGGKISFFQALCVIGYCILPFVFAAFACKMFHMLGNSNLIMFTRLSATGTAFFWSIYASMSFLNGLQAENRKLLGFYPIFLFYFIVTWLVLSNT